MAQIYLDNAATSWPKPRTVWDSMDRLQRSTAAVVGRGNSQQAQQSQRLVERAREVIRTRFGVPRDGEVVFAFNGTDALNLCLLGFLREHDHVVTTTIEHNSVLRPLHHLKMTRQIEVEYVACDDEGLVTAEAIRRALRPTTRLVAISHASNVLGTVQAMGPIGETCAQHGTFLLVDAAQSAGHVDLDMADCGVDFLAMAGHKGLMGPLGTGVVCFSRRGAESTKPLRFGGTGTSSDSEAQPASGPERFEAGNLNTVGIAGMLAGLEYLADHAEHLQEQTHRQNQLVLSQLHEMPHVHLLGSRSADRRVPLASFTVDRYDCHSVATILDSAFDIQVRSGLQCAPRVHHQWKIPGSVRASWGAFTTDEELQRFLEAVEQINEE